MRLSGDVKLNSGPKHIFNQCIFVCHWNLISFSSYSFFKLQSLISYNGTHKFDIICLSESLKTLKSQPLIVL